MTLVAVKATRKRKTKEDTEEKNHNWLQPKQELSRTNVVILLRISHDYL